MRMNEALLALTEAVRLARLEIECYYDDRCRGQGELFATPNARNTVLLSVAGLAVAGALGIAYQKRERA